MKSENLKIFFLILISSFLLYGWYIRIPFGHSDIPYKLLTYGNYENGSLPQTLKNINMPTNLIEDYKIAIRLYGRVNLSPIRAKILTYFFDKNVLLWRMHLLFIMVGVLYLTYILLSKLQFPNFYGIIAVLFLIVLFPGYYIATISGYSTSEFFFILAFLIEFLNCSKTKHTLKYAVRGSICLLIGILFRELTLLSFSGLFFITIFWHRDGNNNIKIKPIWDWKRILPYFVSVLLYVVLYFSLTSIVGKANYAYSNMISFNINIVQFLKQIAFFFRLSIKNHFHLGIILPFIIFALTMFIIITKKVYPSKRSIFLIIVSLLIIFSYALVWTIITIGTGGIFFPVLGSLIIYFTLYDFIIKNISKNVRKIVITFSIVGVIFIWTFQLSYTLQRLECISASNKANFRTVKYVSDNLPENGIVALSGFSIAPSNSFVANVFMNGRIDSIKYFRYRNVYKKSELGNRRYINYLVESFDSADTSKDIPDFIVFYNPTNEEIYRKDIEIEKVISEPIRNFSLKRIIKKNKINEIRYIIARRKK